jgi:mevalonate kinase
MMYIPTAFQAATRRDESQQRQSAKGAGYKADAPGSMMLLGEYAVLHGHAALVCAIDRRITVTLTPRQDQLIHIQSALGEYQTTLSDLACVPPFQFVLATLQYHAAHLKCGCDIEIIADFSDKIGFGSSAAVTVAMLSALSQWLSLHLSRAQLLEQGRAIIQRVQGMGSGADIAASVYGGIVYYRNSASDEVESFPVTHPLVAMYVGYKTPTPVAVQQVQGHFAQSPAAYQHIIDQINQCVEKGVAALRAKQWEKLGEAMFAQQKQMIALGVNDAALTDAFTALNQLPHLLGAKISGAGLGDCVVGLMAATLPTHATHVMSLAITPEGVRDAIA